MSDARWFRLLITTLALQLSTVAPLWAQGELSFTREDFGVGNGPLSVTVGDFNGDGQQDLATPSINPDGVSILRGRGDGTFERFRHFAVGDAPRSVTVGDFNGDRQPDLATHNTAFPSQTASSVSILLGRGDGTFEPAQDYGVGEGSRAVRGSVTMGDFNGDSQQDLATANESGASVSILLGQGDGTFQDRQDVAMGENPVFVTVGDFNDDGRQDLATANQTPLETFGSVSILLGQGDGTFQVFPGMDFGAFPVSLAVDDFNGDGQQDIATANAANTGGNSASILLGNGDGTFQAAPDVQVDTFPQSVTAGDFNGDGQQDLAVRATTVSILLGNGDGTFPVRQDVSAGADQRSVTVGDFNGDGRQDLATANGVGDTVSVLINIATVEITTYRLTRIGDQVTCGGSSCFPIIADMADGAQMVGTTKSLGGQPPRAIFLLGGRVFELGDLLGGAAPNAGATALGGGITGTNQIRDASGNLVTRGVLWQGGQAINLFQIRDLGVDGDTTPLDINAFGQIVGQVVRGNVGMPFLWEFGTTTLLETLFCPGNLGGSARAINNDFPNRVIVGSSNSTVGRRAVIWKDLGRGGILPLEPPFVSSAGEAVDVNDRGEVIGAYSRSDDPAMRMGTALLWQAHDPEQQVYEVTVLPPLDRAEANGARPESINNRGQIVGSTHFGSGQSLATLWQDGGAALDLNELISDDDPAKAFVTLITAIVINNFGLIVALGEDSRVPVGQEGHDAYYLLKPTGIAPSFAAVPSPSASSPPAAASPPHTENGGGAVDLVSLLLVVFLFSVGLCVRRRQRAVLVARPFD